MTNKDLQHECVFVPRLDGWEYCECGNKVQVYDPVQGKHIDERIETIHNAYGSLREKYLMLLTFVKHCADDSYYELSAYETFDTLLQVKTHAFDLLKEIGEL